ncbi:cytochrome C oxidase subunit II [archaeon SCG-AAA382B04]|nr:cytochrome C oxidase subunit II [archaeon SCG-AAA382B04]
MKSHRELIYIVLGVFLGFLLIVSLGSGYSLDFGYGDGRYYPPGCCQGPENFTSNGERIYFTGVSETGERIPFIGGPRWLSVHGGSCVDCHGRDREGGFTPMMCSKETPSITWQHLTEHGMSESDVKTVITEGVEPDGEELSSCMPRWQMSQEDLNDLVSYLKNP